MNGVETNMIYLYAKCELQVTSCNLIMQVSFIAFELKLKGALSSFYETSFSLWYELQINFSIRVRILINISSCELRIPFSPTIIDRTNDGDQEKMATMVW